MTRTTSARVAGTTFLIYAAVGIANEALMHAATSADGTAAKLVRIAEHTTEVRIASLLVLVECFSALVLAVTLYGITRDEDHELSMLGLVCRVAEGVLGSAAIFDHWQLLWLAKAGPAADAALSEFVFMPGPGVPTSTIFYAVGNTIFAYLLARGRIVPAAIAWFGVFACGLLVVALPFELAGFSVGTVIRYSQWLPALVFQLALALWLLIKGVR